MSEIEEESELEVKNIRSLQRTGNFSDIFARNSSGSVLGEVWLWFCFAPHVVSFVRVGSSWELFCPSWVRWNPLENGKARIKRWRLSCGALSWQADGARGAEGASSCLAHV